MSAAIGGRSESIGSAPDKSISQTTSENKKKITLSKKEFENLSDAELAELTGSDPNSKITPFGARLSNLQLRKRFLRNLSAKFITAPSGANIDRSQAKDRITQLDQTINDAKKAQKLNEQERVRLEQSGIKIFAGSLLDLAFSNKTREFSNIISRAESEKQGILLQTDSNARKKFAKRVDAGKFQVNFRRSQSGKTEDLAGVTGRKASLFAVLNELNRTLSLPQFSGERGTATGLKADVGVLNKIQNQRLSAEQKSISRTKVKRDFEQELQEISNSGELTQKQKKQKILESVRKRDKGLKTQTVTNTQFEQSRAGFAASRVNIVSGNTVRLIQDFINLGRKKRNREQ